MARRQEANERFLKWQREADAAKAASAVVAAAGSTGDGYAAANNDNAATTAASSPQYYTITEPSAEKTEPASSTALHRRAAGDRKASAVSRAMIASA